jgi:hypothetical protein
MNDLAWLIDGANLAFVLPLALALVYLGLYVASGITFGDPDVGGDIDHDVDGGDVDHDWHAGGHIETDIHGHETPGHHVEHPQQGDQRPGSDFSLLSWFGLGRVPVSLWLSGAMLGWGAFGIGTAAVFHQYEAVTWQHVALTFAVATVGMMIATRLLTIVVTKIFPLQETYARRRHELLGSVGEAIFPIDNSFGMAGIRDDRGQLFQVGCRVEEGVSPIAKGARVKLVGYSRDTRLYHVIPAVESAEAGTARSGVR